MTNFYNRVRFQSSTSGTGAFGAGAAITGFRAPSVAADGAPVSYTAELTDASGNITGWETGHGTWHSGAANVTRDTPLQGSAALPVNFATAPVVWFDLLAEDIIGYAPLASPVFTGSPTAPVITITGNYFYLNNSTGTVGGAGGPFIYGDATDMVFHIGGAGNFLFRNSAGGTVAYVTSGGTGNFATPATNDNSTAAATTAFVNAQKYVATKFQTALPFVMPSSGSIGNNGALTLNTALPRAYANCYMYFPAAAIVSGSAAGWYFVKMSSTTAGTIYNQTYTTGQPVIPALTAFSTTGPGAFVAKTTIQAAVTYTVPGNTLTTRGTLTTDILVTTSGDTNTKLWTLTFGGTTFGSASSTAATNFGMRNTLTISNREATNDQVSNYSTTAANQGGNFGLGTSGVCYGAVDTTANQDVVLQLTSGNVASYAVLEQLAVRTAVG